MIAYSDIYLGSIITVLSLFYLGYLFIRYSAKELGKYYHLLLAFPIGIMYWASIWIFFSIIIQDTDFGFHSSVNIYTILSCIGSFIIFLYLNLKNEIFTPSEIAHIIYSSITVVILSLYFLVDGSMVLSGDSYTFVKWSQDPMVTLERGFPIVLLSIANLSTLISPDFYLFIIHPLTTLSLVLLIGLSINSLFVQYEIKLDHRIQKLLIAVTLLIFSMNPLVHLNMLYVNHHVLYSILILLLFMLMIMIEKIQIKHLVFIGFLALSASLSRMEGFIFFLAIFGTLCFRYKEPKTSFQLLSTVMIFCAPYLIYLSISFWDGGFVEGQQFATMFLLGIVMSIVVGMSSFRKIIKVENISVLAVFLVSLLLVSLIVLEFQHMRESITVFIRNALTPGAWGALNISLFVLIPYLLYLRKNKILSNHPHDLWFHLFIVCLFLILILGYFRSPFRIGRFDSANRMLFHFLPLITIWASLEIGRLLSLNKFFKTANQ